MWYDLIVLAILLFAAYRGLQRGVIYQIATIASVVLCFVFAQAISAAAAPYVPLDPPLNNWVIMVGAYVAFSFVSFGAARVLVGWLEKAKLNELNRHLGAGFGLLKGLLFALVITFFAITMSPKAREALRDSRSAQYAAVIMDRIHPVMPEKLQGALDNYLAYFDKTKLRAPNSNPNGGFGTGVVNGTDDFLGGLGEIELGQPGQSTNNSGNNGFGFDWGRGSAQNNSQQNNSNNNTNQADPFNFDPFSSNEPFANNSIDRRPAMAPPERPNPFGQASQSQPVTQPSNDFQIDEIIDRLPVTLSGEIERLVRQGLGSATPEQRVRMEQQLNRSSPSSFGDVARSWIANQRNPSQPSNDFPTNQQQPSNGGGFIDNIAGSIYDRATGSNDNSGQSNPARDMFKGMARDFVNDQFGSQQNTNPANTPRTQDAASLVRSLSGFYARQNGGQAANYESSIQSRLQGLSQQAATAVLQDWNADVTGQGVDPNPATNGNTRIDERIQRVMQQLSAQPSSDAF